MLGYSMFAGPADGEFVLKPVGIELQNCRFSIRYSFWHVKRLSMADSKMYEKNCAAICYAGSGIIPGSTLGGIMAVMECTGEVIIRESVVAR